MPRERRIIHSTIDPDLWQWLEDYHWRTRIPKSRILEESLREWREGHDPEFSCENGKGEADA